MPVLLLVGIIRNISVILLRIMSASPERQLNTNNLKCYCTSGFLFLGAFSILIEIKTKIYFNGNRNLTALTVFLPISDSLFFPVTLVQILGMFIHLH